MECTVREYAEAMGELYLDDESIDRDLVAISAYVVGIQMGWYADLVNWDDEGLIVMLGEEDEDEVY